MSETSPGASPGPYSASRLADEIRAAIEHGDLHPGEQLPTVGALADQYAVNKNTASRAVSQLKAEGLLAGPAGGRTYVRIQPQRLRRHNARYQKEKDTVLLRSDDSRGAWGVAESDSGFSVRDLFEDTYRYDVVPGPNDVRKILNLHSEDENVLRRTHRRRHAAGAGASGSTSYLPLDLISANQDLLDSSNEPWPGGTMHQLHTVGIEVDRIDDHIVVTMPSREEQEDFDIPPGIPMIRLRKITWSTLGMAVEVADIPLPADRTELIYTTNLERWQ
ncbi:GntR family transcriptional regulator [Streptomyces sp. NPDC017941]|uniref:GntR family transcriptional regulator n=1 Tax=unclassified Streptomyces TaxID=2593676 RepID=UPI00379F804D